MGEIFIVIICHLVIWRLWNSFYKLGLDTLLFWSVKFCAWVVLVMFLKLKEFGGILYHPEESVPLSIVHVGPYLDCHGLYTAVYWLSF